MTDVDHGAVAKPEPIWVQAREEDATHHYTDRFYNWWSRTYYVETDRRHVRGHLHSRFFQRILGKQNTTATFVHRNWVWHQPEEGWTLYVDRRGPALHVRKGMSAAEAWAAFEKFQDRVDTWLKVNPL